VAGFVTKPLTQFLHLKKWENIKEKFMSFSCLVQRIIHALTHADSNGDHPDSAEQTIPSFNGFHASLNVKQENE